jgi:ParB-like chromosome segregation protein Spo0J
MKLPDHLETIQIDALIPYARNSRTHSDGQVAQIASSIKEFGFTNPVLMDGGGGSLPDMAECSLHASWA